MNIQYTLPWDSVSPWIEKSLTDPLALSVSREIFKSTNSIEMLFHTVAQKGLTTNQLLDFQSGGKVSNGIRPDDWLLDFVENTSCAQSGGFWLIEDWLARPGDSSLHKAGMPALFNGNEVYYVLDLKASRTDPNWPRIRSNRPPLFHAFLVSGTEKPIIGSMLSQSVIDELAKHICLIVFGVYDGESYLVAHLNPTRK